jgi:hypothetical protein
LLQDLPSFNLRLDLARSRAANQVAGVVEGGPASAAGLRDGQALAGVSVHPGDPDRTDEGDWQITFSPRGKPVSAWQFRVEESGDCGKAPVN